MLNRLIAIIYILINKGTVTAGELAERFEVSVRTIYRDVERLSMAGIPVYARKGKNGGISLTERFVLNKMLLSDNEQQRILAALVSLRETGAQREEEILNKLGDFFKTEPSNWVAIDFSDWSDRRKKLFEQLREAILERRVITFDYYGQYGEMSSRAVEPIQLLFKEYTWYLRAYCRKRQSMRLFKILRMKRVQVLDEKFEVKDKLHEANDGLLEGKDKLYEANDRLFEENMETSKSVKGNLQMQEQAVPRNTKIVLQIDKKEAYRVYDRFEEEEIQVLKEGDFLIHMKCPLDDWTYGLILSFGPSAKVLEPEFVQQEIIRRIIKMQKNYSD